MTKANGLSEALIVGVGQSRIGAVPEMNTLGLQYVAAHDALQDAGLTVSDVDGILTTPIRVENWAMPCGKVAQALGITPRYLATIDLAGASGLSMMHHAAMAIQSGQCETVLCVGGQNLLSFSSNGAAVKKLADAGWAHPDFEAPLGPLVPSLYALSAQRHMHEYGTTLEQMAQVAVTLRSHAALNPQAHKQNALTITDIMASKIISSPLRLLDCALVSDGAAAFVLTRKDRVKDLRKAPVKIAGQGYGHSHTYIGDYRDVTRTGAINSGRDAFNMAGLKPADIDIAQLYDCFTITIIIELEDLGFCKKGEGGSFVEGGRISIQGDLPVTTHGGLLSAGHPGLAGGMFHVIEAVRQLRGEAGPRQVKNPEAVLVHGNGGIIGLHATSILVRE